MWDLLLYRIKRPFHFVKTGLLNGVPAQLATHHPEKHLHIIMVTGTDGKTTTATLLHHVLTRAKFKTGLISTIAAKIGNEEIETGLHVTAPQPRQLYQILDRMVTAGCSHAVIEMTSHGAYQYRHWGLRPALGIITTITHEHLDYHVTYEEYVRAKVHLFHQTPAVIIHPQDESTPLVRSLLKTEQIVSCPPMARLSVSIQVSIKQRFSQSYNQRNAALVWTAVKRVGVSPTVFSAAVKQFPGIPGRMQVVPVASPFQVIVDFAHTPAGVKAVLTALRQQLRQSHKHGKLIAVLGCAGLRDAKKRPIMGKLAAQLSDVAVFTAEDPRTEDVWSIIRQMKEQLVTHHNQIVSLADRGEAIHFALTKLAARHDIVVIMGKGHERSMCLGTVEYPWSDVAAVQTIMRTKNIPRVGEWLPPTSK